MITVTLISKSNNGDQLVFIKFFSCPSPVLSAFPDVPSDSSLLFQIRSTISTFYRCENLPRVAWYKKDRVGVPVKISVTDSLCAINHHTIKHFFKNKIVCEPIFERIKFSDHPWINSRWVKYLNVKCKTTWKDRMQEKYFYIIRGIEALPKCGMQPINYKRMWWPTGII